MKRFLTMKLAVPTAHSEKGSDSWILFFWKCIEAKCKKAPSKLILFIFFETLRSTNSLFLCCHFCHRRHWHLMDKNYLLIFLRLNHRRFFGRKNPVFLFPPSQSFFSNFWCPKFNDCKPGSLVKRGSKLPMAIIEMSQFSPKRDLFSRTSSIWVNPGGLLNVYI